MNVVVEQCNQNVLSKMKAHLCHPTMLKNPLIVSFFCKIKSSVFTLTFQNHLESSPDILNSCPVPSPPRRPPVTFPYVLCHALSLGACPSLSWESPFSTFLPCPGGAATQSSQLAQVPPSIFPWPPRKRHLYQFSITGNNKRSQA